MNTSNLLEALNHAESSVRVFQNKKKDSYLKNRMNKFARQPFKFTYLNLLKMDIPLPDLVRVRLFWGDNLYLPLRDENSIVTFYTGTLDLPECAVMRFLIENLKEGDVFYDIGAHFGVYTKLANKLVGPKGEVHSFEPNPRTAKLLRKNSIKFNELAMSHSESEIEFFDTSGKKSATSSALIDAVAKSGVPFSVVTVKATTLDSYVKENTLPNIIKIDVEGWEEEVLQGAVNLLRIKKPTIIMEVWDEPFVIERTLRAVALLKDHGYSSYRILPSGLLKEETPESGIIGVFENFCFIAK